MPNRLLLDLGHGRLARGDERQQVLLLEVVAAVLGRELDHTFHAWPRLPDTDHVAVETCDDDGAQVADAGDERLLFRALRVRRDLPLALWHIATLRNVRDHLHRLVGRGLLHDRRLWDHDGYAARRAEHLERDALAGLAA